MKQKKLRKKSLPQFRRAHPRQLPGLELQERDYSILMALHRFGVPALTTDQIFRLLFRTPLDSALSQYEVERVAARFTKEGKSIKQFGAGRLNVCRRRLKALFHQGYVSRCKFPRHTGPGCQLQGRVYWLTGLGRTILADYLGVSIADLEPISDSDPTTLRNQLRHRLIGSEVHLGLSQGAKALGLTIHYMNEVKINRNHSLMKPIKAELKDGRIYQEKVIIPDSFTHIKVPSGKHLHMFLEVDNGTETLAEIMSKVRRYNLFYNSGTFAHHYNANEFVVTFIGTTEKRKDNMRQAARTAKGRERFLFTSWEELDRYRFYEEPANFLIAPLWQRADVQVNSPYHVDAFISLVDQKHLRRPLEIISSDFVPLVVHRQSRQSEI